MSSVLEGIAKQPAQSLQAAQAVQPAQSVLGGSIVTPPEPEHREFTDTNAVRRNIYNGVLKAVNSIGPLQNARHTLQLRDVDYVDPDEVDLKQQKQAIMTGKSLYRRLRGTWELTDNASGQVLDKRAMTIAQVPHLTPRGTFVLNGTEYTLSNQMRLRPGVFTRVKENGEIESHINVMPGNGISHRYFLDPETGIFKINLGQAKLPLLPVLRALGVTDKELRKNWGDELVNANLQAPDGKTINKLYQRLIRKPEPGADEPLKSKAIADLLHSMKLDPEVTKRTLGRPHEYLTKDAILDTTRKLIRVSRQEEDPDDRDHLAFQTFYGPEDLLSERITKDKASLRQLLWKSSFKGDLSRMQPGALTRQLHATIMHTGLGQAAEEINPAELLDAQTRTTRLGEGGIGSMDAVPDEARNVQPSHFGYIDPIRTPESFKVGVDTRLTHTARKGTDGRLYAPYIDVKSGKTTYKTPQDVTDATVAFPGELAKNKAYVAAMVGGTTKFVPREQVQFELPHMENVFSPLANMIPLKSALKGQRMAMGSRYLAQALPVVNREAPLVQGAMPGKHLEKSFEDLYGTHLGAVRAEQGGYVKSVTEDGITVTHDDGKVRTHQLYNHFPYSRKSVTGDSEIYIRRNGCIHVLRIDNYDWHENDETLSIDPDTKVSKWARVRGYTKHQNDKKLYKVTTRSGRSVVVTEDHSLMTVDYSGNLIPIYPKDCVIGKTRVPIASVHEANTGNTAEVDTSADNARQAAQGVLIGLYAAAGHCPSTQAGLVAITVSSAVRGQEVIALLNSLGYQPFVDAGQVCFIDHSCAAELAATCGQTEHDKHLPANFMSMPYEFRKGIVAGYFAAAGQMARNPDTVKLKIMAISRALRDNLVDLLSSLGVFCILEEKLYVRASSKWRNAFGLRVVNSHIDNLSPWFFYKDRELFLEDLLYEVELRQQTPGVHIPGAPFVCVPVINKRARETRRSKAGYDGRCNVATKFTPRTNVNKEKGGWERSAVLWDIVTSIVPAAHEDVVYDLSVEKCESFTVCHGLLVHNTFIHNTPLVKAGQRIEQDQLLAHSNYTDNQGTAALGINGRVAFIPFRGANYEDAAVISESFAKKLTSEHMYSHDQEWNENVRKGLKPFVSLFPTEYSKQQLANMDENGVIKPGTEVHYGDPLVLVAEQKEQSHSQVHRGRKPTYANKTLLWEHHAPGIVTDAAHTAKGVSVAVKSHNQMQVGDKLSNRYGGKGVVAEIMPDDQMPHDKSGTPYDIALNPLGMISRINPVQVAEMVLAKIAKKTGKPYKLEDFSKIDDLVDFVQGEMKKHGVPDTETIIDPETGREIPDVLTGYQYLLKLHHTSEAKGQGRGIGGYTSEEIPARGGSEGSKRIALLETNALLSHGATETLRDAHLVRGQKNDLYWQSFMSGFRPPEPQVPLVYRKFVDSLKASGINAVRTGRQLHVMALTDKDIDQLAGDRNIENVETVDWKEGLRPRKGGLFDQALTGGHSGNRWAAIKLHEPMPNPAFEEPIRRMLGMTQKRFEQVLAGNDSFGEFGSGPGAIKAALENINVDKGILQAEAEIKGSKKGARDEAIRKLAFLKSAKRLGIAPKDWMLSRVPVLPPIYRPVSVMQGSGNQLVSDANYLYKELYDANSALKELHGRVSDISGERLNVYNAFKGVVGLGDPIQPKNQERQVKGVLQHVFGTSPKFGMVQRQLLGSAVELVGRAVITPNPDLDMDQVGLPENKAWDVYKPFIIRRLVQRGVPRLEAARYFKDQAPLARQALLAEMSDRPVVISRAPVLHRYGIMGFRPILVKGDVMQIPPLTTSGFNADFDGDTMNYHVPATDEAKQEVIDKLLPSRNLLSATNFKAHYVPEKEYQGGLYHASTAKDTKRRPVVFRNKQDAVRAYREGRIKLDTPVEIVQH